MSKPKFQKRSIFMVVYIVFALLPIYWMINMSFKTNNEISGQLLALADALHLGELQAHIDRSCMVHGPISTA